MWRGRKKEEIWACSCCKVALAHCMPHGPSIHSKRCCPPFFSSSADLDKRRRGTMYEQEERGCLAGSARGEGSKAFSPLRSPSCLIMIQADDAGRLHEKRGSLRYRPPNLNAAPKRGKRGRTGISCGGIKQNGGRQEGVPSFRSVPSAPRIVTLPSSAERPNIERAG